MGTGSGDIVTVEIGEVKKSTPGIAKKVCNERTHLLRPGELPQLSVRPHLRVSPGAAGERAPLRGCHRAPALPRGLPGPGGCGQEQGVQVTSAIIIIIIIITVRLTLLTHATREIITCPASEIK